MIRNAKLRAARGEDFEAIKEILTICGLPPDNACDPTSLHHVFTIGGSVICCASGDQYGEIFAIKTVAVLPQHRGNRLATYIVSALLMRARAKGCTKATVLTDGHPGFFAQFGFTLTPVDRVMREMKLSGDVVRRFGPRTHYMCGRL